MPGCACWFKNVSEKKGSFFEKQVFKWRPLWPGGGGPAGVYTTKTPAAILKSYAEPPRGWEHWVARKVPGIGEIYKLAVGEQKGGTYSTSSIQVSVPVQKV